MGGQGHWYSDVYTLIFEMIIHIQGIQDGKYSEIFLKTNCAKYFILQGTILTNFISTVDMCWQGE